MADALERVTNLVALLLEARTPLTLDQIVHELAGQYPQTMTARRAAFERDKAMLRDIGVPVESVVLGGADAGKSAYFVDRRRYELADLSLDDDERAALELAASTVRLGDTQFGLWKVGGALGGAPAGAVLANVPDLAALPALREATARHAPVGFDYRGSRRSLWPYALMLRRGFWYVIGNDLAHGEVRTFRVDRIDGAVEVGAAGAFTRPEGFDPRAAFPYDPKQLGADALTATVRVAAARAAEVVSELGEAAVTDRHDDGTVDVEVGAANRAAFLAWLFGLGEYAQVLAPPDVRADVVDWLRRMLP